MKIKQLFIGVFSFSLLVTFSACGPNAAEQARLQSIHDDSVKNAVEFETKQKFEAKEAMENSIRNLGTQLNGLNNRIEFLKANLEVANDEMDKVKEFHFGRTDSEREQQIRGQSLKIQNIEDEISSLQDKINQGSSKIAELQGNLKNTNN